ncbi:hypothetical protein DP49_5170 [Burkholderia pseudomallei]|nr:hypothetical protein DP49_5170 [Burkholderia pseudomallei]
MACGSGALRDCNNHTTSMFHRVYRFPKIHCIKSCPTLRVG